MCEILTNEVLNALREENNSLLNDLCFERKLNLILENLKNYSLVLINSCKCDRNQRIFDKFNEFNENYAELKATKTLETNEQNLRLKSETILSKTIQQLSETETRISEKSANNPKNFTFCNECEKCFESDLDLDLHLNRVHKTVVNCEQNLGSNSGNDLPIDSTTVETITENVNQINEQNLDSNSEKELPIKTTTIETIVENVDQIDEQNIDLNSYIIKLEEIEENIDSNSSEHNSNYSLITELIQQNINKSQELGQSSNQLTNNKKRKPEEKTNKSNKKSNKKSTKSSTKTESNSNFILITESITNSNTNRELDNTSSDSSDSELEMIENNKSFDIKCNECEEKLKSKLDLEIHSNRVHKKIDSFVCHECQQIFNTKDLFSEHLSESHRNPNSNSETESSVVLLNIDLEDNRQKLVNKWYKCSVIGCEKSLGTRYGLQKHMRTVHKKGCKECTDIFDTKDQLLEHMAKKHRIIVFKCRLCDYKTQLKACIKRHQLTHSAKKQSIRQILAKECKSLGIAESLHCNHCSFQTTSSWELIQHKTTHTTTNNQLKCDFKGCKKSFRNKKYLTKHKKYIHLSPAIARKSSVLTVNAIDKPIEELPTNETNVDTINV